MKLLKEDYSDAEQFLLDLLHGGKLDVAELKEFGSGIGYDIVVFFYDAEPAESIKIIDFVYGASSYHSKEDAVLDCVDRLLVALENIGVNQPVTEALYGREEIDDYLKKMKEIGIKNLGDLRKFKQNVKSDIGKDIDSDIEQIRMYRDALGKDFKIEDEEPKKKVVGEKLDLDEALSLKGKRK